MIRVNLIGERRSVKNLIFWSLIAWGVLASVQGLLTNVTALIVVRFLVGVVEAAVLPAMVIFLSHWFTKSERGRANTFLILGNPVTVLWLSVVSGYLIELTSWRGMFVIEGIPAGLPVGAGVKVAHKTGSFTGVYHDAAIVEPPRGKPFVLRHDAVRRHAIAAQHDMPP